MKLSGNECRNIIFEDDEDWKPVSKENIEDISRWSIHKSRVFQYIPTGKYYEFYWSIGATEMQDELPYEYDKEYEPIEVISREVSTTIWEKVNRE